jgi:hypothetical protein
VIERQQVGEDAESKYTHEEPDPQIDPSEFPEVLSNLHEKIAEFQNENAS